jgi:hypothetical protein
VLRFARRQRDYTPDRQRCRDERLVRTQPFLMIGLTTCTHSSCVSYVQRVFKFNQSMAGVATLRIRRSDFGSGPTRCQWRNNTASGAHDNTTFSSILAPYGCVVLRYGNVLEDDGTVGISESPPSLQSDRVLHI